MLTSILQQNRYDVRISAQYEDEAKTEDGSIDFLMKMMATIKVLSGEFVMKFS